MKLLDWLDKRGMISRDLNSKPSYLAEIPSVKEILAELFYKNKGSPIINQICFKKEEFTLGGPFGRIGLSLKEALLFANLTGVMNGFFLSEDLGKYQQGQIMALVQNEITRVEEEFAKEPKIALPSPGETEKFGIPQELKF